MLELLGTHYIIDHCIEVHRKEDSQEAYDFYVSEMIRSIANSISSVLGGGEFDKSWDDMQNYHEETRTPEEIKTSILDKLKALG